MGPVLPGQKLIIVPKGMKVGPQLVQQASRPRLSNGMLTTQKQNSSNSYRVDHCNSRKFGSQSHKYIAVFDQRRYIIALVQSGPESPL
jgi:hypothetical protein